MAGLGSVGMRVACSLNARELEGLTLAAVSARNLAHGDRRMARFGTQVAMAKAGRIAKHANVVVECLPPSEFMTVAAPVVEIQDSVLVVTSVGALLEHKNILETALKSGARVIAPSGAIVGLDALRAGKLAGLTRVKLVTRKPPLSFGETLLIDGKFLSTHELTESVMLFGGNAREAVSAFPKNINVAATVSLAGLGPDRTEVEIWADPACKYNTHELRIWSAAGEVTAAGINLPDSGNPKSSAITAYSVLACLQRLAEPFSIGS